MTFYTKKNNTSPEYQVTLQASDGSVMDMTGATVRFHMVSIRDGTVKVDAAATLVTPASGIVKYSWAAGDLDTPGWYTAEFEVTYSDASVESFPNDGYMYIVVTDTLA